MPSFDVVSKTDLMEVDNAINGVRREIQTRFDLKGKNNEINRDDNTLTMAANDAMMLRQLEDLLRSYLVRRKLDTAAFDFQKPQDASGGTVRQNVAIKQGIDSDMGRKISRAVKGTKIKVQVVIQGSELRVSGKTRDDLQSTIKFIKEMELNQPLQYVNFRN